MFCDEIIRKVYIGVIENDDVYSHDAFFDCYHDIAYHCTEGYRIVLETENYAISLTKNGVIKEKTEDLCEAEGEWLYPGTECIDDSEWVQLETTFFVGEKLISVTQKDELYLLEFDDFLLKLIPHTRGDEIDGLNNKNHFSFNRILGCNRHLKRKCPICDGEGEILMDHVGDFVVRCKNCKKSTWAGMNLINAIDDWNNCELDCDLSDIIIE